MILKFIGKDGYMGLKHEHVYDCDIDSRWCGIWVIWSDRATMEVGSCPYYSLKSLNEDWCDA